MFTVKRIINGATTVSEHETVTIAPNGSAAFNDAIEFTKAPSPVEDLQQIGFDVGGIIYSDPDSETVTSHINGVTVICDADRQNVLVSSCPGTLPLSEALGVVIVDMSKNGDVNQEVQYDFIYPGEEVYVVNSHGSTVAQLRR